MRALWLVLVCLVTACTHVVTVRNTDGSVTTLPADVYAHQLSTSAYAAHGRSSEACFAKATDALGLAVCRLGEAGQSQPAPVYQPGPSAFDRVLQAGSILTPLGLALIEAKQQDRANERMTLANIRIAEANATRETRIVEAIAQQGSSIAGAGFQAMTSQSATLGSTATTAILGFTGVIQDLPETTVITAGGDIVGRDQIIGDYDQSSTAVECVVSNAPSTAGSAQSGTTGPASAGSATGSTSAISCRR